MSEREEKESRGAALTACNETTVNSQQTRRRSQQEQTQTASQREFS
jgi:hypothetical protein